MRAALSLTIALALASTAEAADAVVIRDCRVVRVSGKTIAEGAVVVEDGRITSVGKASKVKVPPGATIVEARGRVLTPGFVHPATRLTLRGTGGGSSGTVDPKHDVTRELAPWRGANRYSAASGFTALALVPGNGLVGGRGLLVRTAADGMDGLVVKSDVLLRVTVGGEPRFAATLAGALSAARKELLAKAKYDADLAKWKTAKTKAEAAKKPVPKEPPKPKTSSKNESYRKVLSGDMLLLAYVNSSSEVHLLATGLADEKVRGVDLRLAVVASGEAYRASGVLADLGATCLVRAGVQDYAGTTERICPAVLYRRAGCEVVLLPPSDNREGLRAFPWALAVTVRAGFPRDAAIRAATLGPAELLGLGKQHGAIAKKRRADLVLWSGDPLASTTRIERVWVGGEPVEAIQ